MPIKVFFCYAHEDEALLNKLKTHLRPLQRQGLIDVWHDRDIRAGTEWEEEIRKHLNEADIILLLVSPSFMDSDYCYGNEMKRAIERHEKKEARVIPIILEYVYWQIEPLKKLQALPTDAKPIISASWHSQNEALYNVVEGIQKVFKILPPKPEEFVLVSDFEVHDSEFFLMSFSSDGQMLTGASYNGEIRLRHPLTGQVLRTIKTGANEAIPTFSPDGQLLAASCGDKKIRLWYRHTGQLFRTIEVGIEDALAAFSPDGQLLAAAAWREDTIRLWHPYTGQLLRTIEVDEAIGFPIFSPDGQILTVASNDEQIRLWHPYTGQLLRTIEIGTVGGMPAFSPNGQLLVANCRDGKIGLWHPYTGQLLRTIEIGTLVGIPTFSPDGQLLVIACDDNKIRIWGKK